MDSLFGIGPMELVFIFLLAFILLGPRDLPRMAYQLGRWLHQLQLLYAEFRQEWEAEVREVSREIERATLDQPELNLPPEAAAYQLPPTSESTHATPSPTDHPSER